MSEILKYFLCVMGLIFIALLIPEIIVIIKCKTGNHSPYKRWDNTKWCQHCGKNVNYEHDSE